MGGHFLKPSVRVVLSCVLVLALTPLAHAEEVNVGDGLLVISVDEDRGVGSPGVRVHASSSPAGAKYDYRAGCRVDVYANSCQVIDTSGAGAPVRFFDATTRYSAPQACVDATWRPDAKGDNSATACAPGRVYPVPWGKCVRVEFVVQGVIASTSERCLVP